MDTNLTKDQVYTNPHLFRVYLNDRFVTAGKAKPKAKCPIPFVHKLIPSKPKFHPDNTEQKIERRDTVAKYFEKEEAEQCLKNFTETIYDKKNHYGVEGISELKTWSDFEKVINEMLNTFKINIVDPLLDTKTARWVNYTRQDDDNGFGTNMLGAFENMLRFNFGIFKVIKDLKPKPEEQGTAKYFEELKTIFKNSYQTIRAFSDLHMGIFVKALNINGVFDIVGSSGEPYELRHDNFEIKENSVGKEELVISPKFLDGIIHSIETNPMGYRYSEDGKQINDVNLSLNQKALGCLAKEFKLPKIKDQDGNKIGGNNMIKESFDWIDRVISSVNLKALEWNKVSRREDRYYS